MDIISVRGPMEDGNYHLGYKDAEGNFSLIAVFSSLNLACATAGRMTNERKKAQEQEGTDGIPPA